MKNDGCIQGNLVIISMKYSHGFLMLWVCFGAGGRASSRMISQTYFILTQKWLKRYKIKSQDLNLFENLCSTLHGNNNHDSTEHVLDFLQDKQNWISVLLKTTDTLTCAVSHVHHSAEENCA